MSNWNSGYVADIAYTYGYYQELSPSHLSLVATNRAQQAPDPSGPINYCELGSGQGLTTNILAAANPHSRFYATDFNPAHVASSRRLAAEAGLENVTFYDTSFSDFAEEKSLPEEFDIISLHGIYSWVNADLRAAIVDFIARKLKVGGLLYISYNCMPGWAAAAPMRHLMYMHGKVQGGPTATRLQPALDFIEKIQKSNALYFRSNPLLEKRFEMLKGQNRNYLTHEYFNDIWEPFYHADVVRDLDAAKLTYISSASLLEDVDVINLTEEQQKILGEIADPVLRETTRDYMTNKQFRRDVFVKGAHPLPPRLARETWLDRRFVLVADRSGIELKAKGALGEAKLQEEVYNPLLERLAGEPKTVRELVADPAVANLGWARLQQALTVLVGANYLMPCLSARDEGKRVRATKAFNRAVLLRAQDNGNLQFLASPVTGGGVVVPRFHQLFLLALSEGKKQPQEWAQFAWDVLNRQGERITKEGNVLQSAEENLKELNEQAASFAEKRLPVLRALQIA